MFFALLGSLSANAQSLMLSEITTTRSDSVFHTKITYNSRRQAVCLVTQMTFSDSDFTNWQYIEQEFVEDKKTSLSKYVWRENQWNKLYRCEWRYENDLLLGEKEFVGKDNLWCDSVETVFTYENNVLKSETKSYKIGETTSETKTDYEHKNDTTFVEFSYQTNNIWQPYGRVILTENTEQSTCLYDEFDESWQNRKKFVRYFDKSTKPHYETQQTFVNQAWVNAACRIIKSDKSNRQNELWQSWKQCFWSDIHRISKTNESITNYILDNKEWLPTQEIVTTYNFSDLPTTIVCENLFWHDDFGGKSNQFLPITFEGKQKFVFGNQLELSYITNTSTNDSPFKVINIDVYPNPSPSGIFYIEAIDAQQIKYAVYDLQGRCLASENNGKHHIVDISHLPNSLYLLHVTVDGTKITKKIFKN